MKLHIPKMCFAKLKLNYSPILFLIPLYAWYKYWKTVKYIKNESEAKEMFYKKHNCVVMYRAENSMFGWPEYPNGLQLSLKTYNNFSEPIEYFIDTAKRTLDIAMMLITIKSVLEAMLRALNRGVRVRLITNHEHMKSEPYEKKLLNSGAEIMYFISYDVESIMHFKYAVKDCHDGGGYVLLGSLNWTQSGLFNNYEDLVFTTSTKVVKTMRCNFEETWKFLQTEKETNEFVKFTLSEK